MKKTLHIVERETSRADLDWEGLDARIPECPVFTQAEPDEEWYRRQHEKDLQRKPVNPPQPPQRRAIQIEMFKDSQDVVFESDGRFESFQVKPDPKEGGVIGKVVLTVDSSNPYRDLAPLLKLQDQFMRILVASTGVSAKDLD
ncbi:MAG TPA: hypothetical protein PK250_12880 [Syntrophobacter fumaroxidans]|nr:hypothetical protein [Syntrophobacter fumaroxidans]